MRIILYAFVYRFIGLAAVSFGFRVLFGAFHALNCVTTDIFSSEELH